MENLESKIPGWELQPEDFIPFYGMFKYQRRCIGCTMENLKEKPPTGAAETLNYFLKDFVHLLPRKTIILFYNLGLLWGGTELAYRGVSG